VEPRKFLRSSSFGWVYVCRYAQHLLAALRANLRPVGAVGPEFIEAAGDEGGMPCRGLIRTRRGGGTIVYVRSMRTGGGSPPDSIC
jgi:hypothetical protein